MSPVNLEDPHFLHRPYSPLGAYGQSKTANIWFATELDRRFADRGLHAFSAHPGGIGGHRQSKRPSNFVNSAGTSPPPMRNPEGSDLPQGERLVTTRLDVTDLDSIDTAVATTIDFLALRDGKTDEEYIAATRRQFGLNA